MIVIWRVPKTQNLWLSQLVVLVGPTLVQRLRDVGTSMGRDLLKCHAALEKALPFRLCSEDLRDFLGPSARSGDLYEVP